MLRLHVKSTLIALFFPVAFLSTIHAQPKLFEDNRVLELTLSGEMQELLKDRGGDPQYHALSLIYKNDDGHTRQFAC
ncbi:MAG: hypothetical protein U5K54_01495 [Cytophagales bacterium]|nr:hypothetical protein [Cytophagales bacterium]